MAVKRFLPRAVAVAQVGTIRITAYDAGTTYKITIGGVTVSVLGTTDAAGTAEALAHACAASTHPYFAQITWTHLTDTITLTGKATYVGNPFTAVASVSGAAGTIGAYAAVTAATGPNDPTNAVNYTGAAVPGAGDTLIIDDPNVRLVGADLSGWGTLALVQLPASLAGQALCAFTPQKFALYPSGSEYDEDLPEYRSAKLIINASRFESGDPKAGSTAGGTGRAIIDVSNVACAIHIFGTGSSLDTDRSALRLLGNSASSHIYARGGSWGTAEEPDETATFGTVNILDDGQGSTGNVTPRTTWTNWTQTGGDNVARAAADATKVIVHGGTLRTEGDWKAAFDVYPGGRLYPNHEKTAGSAISTLALYGGEVDALSSRAARTWDAVKFYNPDAKVRYDKTVVTVTAITNERTGPVELSMAAIA